MALLLTEIQERLRALEHALALPPVAPDKGAEFAAHFNVGALNLAILLVREDRKALVPLAERIRLLSEQLRAFFPDPPRPSRFSRWKARLGRLLSRKS
ncbi:hypothetical protein SAMN05421823_106242 [Catalinimonas alkaloidigena]|uniref:Uncharacterized protein n=1 Tax=Catalinimonas alkaloidigena TaxID=1075417 RepID=A0A1G9KSK0_9BACT|nr:hypothetical protein [Catalinimonas alkaloidigena]SDL52544.1 hypothetical protein SAMN05421823_106242 [Catalinimonas alkaloidigena]